MKMKKLGWCIVLIQLAAGSGKIGFALTASERRLTMSEKYLGLIGPEDSVYLRLIQREAEKALEVKDG